MTLSFVEKFHLRTSKLVMTYYGRNSIGGQFFAYISCDGLQVEKMRNDFETKNACPADSYGEVIYCDEIAEPDNKAKEFLQKWLSKNDGEFI